MSSASRSISCPHCSASIDAAALLERLAAFYEGLAAGVAACPACGKWVDLSVQAGALVLGYTYWAGSMHFEGVTEARVGPIRIVGEGRERAIELRGVTYRPNAKDGR